jgi:Transmembrane domain of unknown function (DUF3566)
LDRDTDRSGGSGSPTVVTSLPDDDDLVVDDDITIDGEVSANGAAKNGAAADGVAARDIPAVTDPAAQNGLYTDDADTAAVPAMPADSIGMPRGSQRKVSADQDRDAADHDEPAAAAADDTMVFTFDRPVSAPVAPAADDWAAADNGQPSPEDSRAVNMAADLFGTPVDRASFRSAPAEQTAPSPAPPDPGPPAPAVSAAAFAWEMPDPPPTSSSSPARAFLRSAGTVRDPVAGPPPGPPPPAWSPTAPTAPPQAPPRVTSARPATTPKGSSQRPARQAHLTVARVEPWSVAKFTFVVSLVAFVILFVAVSVLYESLSALGVFESLQRVVSSVTSSQASTGVNVAKWYSASKVLGVTAILGGANIVLITAMSTIGAVVYNLISRLVGGVEVTLRETD